MTADPIVADSSADRLRGRPRLPPALAREVPAAARPVCDLVLTQEYRARTAHTGSRERTERPTTLRQSFSLAKKEKARCRATEFNSLNKEQFL